MPDTEAVLSLPDFLAARYDEAEAKALAAARVYGKDWHVNASDPMRACVHGDMGDPVVLDVEGAEPAEFIAAFDPRSVLADIAAKRKIIDEHQYAPPDWPGRIVRLLGEPFANHPDYKESWRP